MPTSLASRCQQDFDPADRKRGRDYFEQGLVQIVDLGQRQLEATVQGSGPDPYRVVLDWSAARRGEIAADCTCARFGDGYLCKHIWATLLAADSGNPGKLVPGHSRLYVIDLETGEDDDSFGGDDDPMDEYATALLARMPAPFRTAFQGLLPKSQSRAAPPKNQWQRQLTEVSNALGLSARSQSPGDGLGRTKQRAAWFGLNVQQSVWRNRLAIDLYMRETKKNGEWGKLKPLKLSEDEITRFPHLEDRELLGLLLDGGSAPSTSSYYYGYTSYGTPAVTQSAVRPALYDLLLPRLCATGRFGWIEPTKPDGGCKPLAWDAGEPWQFELQVELDPQGKRWQINGLLRRGEETVDLAKPALLLAEGLVVFPDCLARLDAREAFGWIAQLRRDGPVLVPRKQQDQLLEQLWQMPVLPAVRLPDELRLEQVRGEPRPRIAFRLPQQSYGTPTAQAEISFDYGGHLVGMRSAQSGIVDRQNNRVLLRDRERERAAMQHLAQLGLKPSSQYGATAGQMQIAAKQLPRVIHALIAAGWHVEAEGWKVRQPGAFSMSVTTGVDWFELATECDFDGVSASLPELLAAVRKGEQFVVLSDGSRGMLPEDWLKKYAPLAELGEAQGEVLRFRPSQAALLDALLAAQPNADVDAAFRRITEKLRGFSGVEPSDQPPGFVGQLRDYQRAGLGWLYFLNEFRLGGCLADDMGLGKTIQVLALLENRRQRPMSNGEPRSPSLAVVPRSLIQNWIEEAARFTPTLRVLDYTGLGRKAQQEQFEQYDLVVTTYGTLRRDIAVLQDCRFDYAILDEAQAVKNPASQAAKACRLIPADHRLAMSGTPVENRLAELWSIFEFLNPGMLGRSSAVKLFTGNGQEDGSLHLLAQALRPYILRRTKEQVLRELPAKTEQTLYCELDARQQKQYDELRDHYRALLTQKIDQVGLKKSKMHVLEALLRLRQAACHPALLDPAKLDQPSAKLETLLEQLSEVLAEGHKALVFSQFTSLLAIVRHRLDANKTVYEYLDGKTRKRQEKVDRFQQDPDCKLFLISLKAGGLGLNLTAADYVFILDPWWNPAVEAQAVDRAHRIGQTQPVFAYRLIAKGTVEEKILELQKDKRNLAEAIISADNSLISNLSAEDLRLLLS